MSERPFADLTDVTLADEDTNSILTDNAIPRQFATNASDSTWSPGPGGKTNASGACWWPNLELMQVSPSGGQIWN